jgi:hypothetical protein
MLNMPLAGQVADPHPPVPASDAELGAEESARTDPASEMAVAPLDEPLPPLDEPPLDGVAPELLPASTS